MMATLDGSSIGDVGLEPKEICAIWYNLRKDGGELVQENALIPSSMGGLNSQMDRTAKNIEVALNSNSSKGDYPILSNLVDISLDSNLN